MWHLPTYSFHYALAKTIDLCEGVHEYVHSLSSLRAGSWGFPAEYQVSKEFSLKITTGNEPQAWCETLASRSRGNDHFLQAKWVIQTICDPLK